MSTLDSVPMELFTDAQTTPFKTEWRRARIENIVDADTVDLKIDLGFDVFTVTRCRLLGINAYEIKGVERPKGLKALERVAALIPEGSWVRIRSHKGGSREKYGRWLVEILYLASGDAPGVCWVDLGGTLLAEGHALPYKG